MSINKINELVMPLSIQGEINEEIKKMSMSNKVYLSPESPLPSNKYYLILKGFILFYQKSNQVPEGKIFVNKKCRQFLSMNLIDQVYVQLYEPKQDDKPAASVTLILQMMYVPQQRVQIDDLSLGQLFAGEFQKFYLNNSQIFVYNYHKMPLVLSIDKIVGGRTSFLGKNTVVNFIAQGVQKIRLKSKKNEKKNIFTQNFSLENLGIGGLDTQLINLFRRAFASRRLPHSIIEKFGMKHIKGILLYGPPGTGKTLIARQLSKSLKAKSLTKVNGPEIFSKYVGESEQNIRKLFIKPRQDEKKFGDQSPLHVIVFDEIDAICRQRGSDSSSVSGSKDAVVNQLLTNLDGVQALNNIVVIGMTNRKDLIDQAVLRPGRLQVHIEIGLPDKQGRQKIFKIHTKQLQNQHLINKQVSMLKLAELTKNYTGAQIQGVVKNASSYAMIKGNDVMNFTTKFKLQKDVQVMMNDFKNAISQIPPTFGQDHQNLELILKQPLIDFGKNYHCIKNIMSKILQYTLNGSQQITSLLLYGPNGTGKTSIASQFAKNSSLAYVKIITPEKFLGVNYWGKINIISKIFSNAYRCKQALIIVDNIERLIEYVEIGYIYNNHLMQAFMTLISSIPNNPDCRIMIIGTTSNLNALKMLQMHKVFNFKLQIPNLTKQECNNILGYSLATGKTSIKKLRQFQQIYKQYPQAMWKQLWSSYQEKAITLI